MIGGGGTVRAGGLIGIVAVLAGWMLLFQTVQAEPVAGTDPPAEPDTVWAVRLPAVATFDSALTLHGTLRENGIAGFARIRADSLSYWYELFAGPSKQAAAAVAARDSILRLGLAGPLQVVSGLRDDLVHGAVIEPPPAVSAAAAETDTTAAAADANAAAPSPELPRVPGLQTYVPAAYPAEAIAAGLEGTVVVQVRVDPTGSVRQADVVTSIHPDLDRAALAAASRCRFEPTGADSNAALVTRTIPFAFKLP